MTSAPHTSSGHIVVVGSGIAGLIAALELSRRYRVTLVTKAELEESNTRWAQGGIAVALFEETPAEHIADTLRAGAGLCNVAAVEKLCNEGPQRIRDLIALGVNFDRKDGELAQGLEAAHSRPRILHAGGDSTGLSIETALARAVRSHAGIAMRDHTFACDLAVRDGRVRGLTVLTPDGMHETIEAAAVVLASGGAGQMFLHTTNPTVATGDGTAMALRAGAQLADVEFYQFHPTALVGTDTFLISEAVRGEGAVLLDVNGHRFMQAIAPEAELAPRDVVARGIAQQMAEQQGEPVMLDATSLGEEFLAKRFPTIDAASRVRGLDWAHQPIPVTPAAHYWMGGVRSDLDGRTSLPGLFAVGEAACTGVHGANRLASNSLLESLVFAWACAALLNDAGNAAAVPAADIRDAPGAHVSFVTEDTAAVVLTDRKQLQALMWTAAGIERTAAGLQAAARKLAAWRVEGDDVHSHETRNLLELARVLVAAALAREESRGAHFRLDFLNTEAAFAHSLIVQEPAQQPGQPTVSEPALVASHA